MRPDAKRYQMDLLLKCASRASDPDSFDHPEIRNTRQKIPKRPDAKRYQMDLLLKCASRASDPDFANSFC